MRQWSSFWFRVLALFLFLFILRPCIANAQTWDEFFKQKKTQKKYLLEQLVALKVYAGYVAKGYQTVHSGLDLIRNFSDGELTLHDLFISSLNSPSPLIRTNARVGQILSFQLRIRQKFNSLRLAGLPVEQRQYVDRVRDHVLEANEKDLDELLRVINAGDLEMDDAERLERLDRIYSSMEDKWQFTGSFVSDVRELMLMKRQSVDESAVAGKLYGITD